MIEIDTRQMRVWLDGGEIRLRPRQFGLLAVLAGLPGHTIQRTQLLAAGWGTTYSGYGHALDQAVSRLRSAIGDPSLIETIPRRGYRLRGDLEVRVS